MNQQGYWCYYFHLGRFHYSWINRIIFNWYLVSLSINTSNNTDNTLFYVLVELKDKKWVYVFPSQRYKDSSLIYLCLSCKMIYGKKKNTILSPNLSLIKSKLSLIDGLFLASGEKNTLRDSSKSTPFWAVQHRIDSFDHSNLFQKRGGI